ncbi:MAG: PAS domain S-box protein [Caldilineaceae bacterium]|nr:PAS domain S-box protein [Caldilineaceae bacterium]
MNAKDAAETPVAFPLIGLVGNAGSRQVLPLFFRNMPTDGGMAFIVVTRMAAKQHQQLLAALMARTDMPVVLASDGAIPQADHIYLVPHGAQLTVEHGRLRLQNLARTGNQGPIDTFLFSLAADQGANAAAVLLSGNGDDGVAGLQQLKAKGGLVLIQEPDDAPHAALPRRAMATGIADCVGRTSELAQYLVQTKGDLANENTPNLRDQDENFSQLFTGILVEIAKQTGHDLIHYKPSTLQRRILRRMGMAGLTSLAQYLQLLQTNVDETIALFRDCLVSVTSFFRDADAYEMLERDCVPQLFREKGRSDFVRVWVAGCATGEEAYSVAIQLAERAALANEPPRLQVFATDLDAEAIATARRGLYPAAVAKDIAPARLQRYFTEENGYYRVKPEIREHVLFAVHDLLKDPPFSRLDLICCRNVLIYFNREAQEKVFDIFHYALNANGYLFLGTSESADAANDLFAVLNKNCHLYQRREVVTTPQRRPLSAPTSLAALGGRLSERMTQRLAAKPRTIEELYTAWSLRVHTPPRLLVNDNYDITHLFGGAERYLQERDGAITQNVLQKILPDLRLDLRAALYQAFQKGERTISRLLRVDLANQAQMLQLQVGPVAEPGFPSGYVEVVFAIQADSALFGLPTADEAMEIDLSLVARMEEELLRTRERLQTIIEEYEVSSQELKASNEELQSINEELKSTTEELETSKEELQSMNEELITVNSELTRKLEELHRANSDLLNLVASTDVGAIFLSNTLSLKRFTPRATDLFNLIEGDVGRPFSHVTHRLRHSGLYELAAHVQATDERIEETVQRDDARWFILRLFPYRTITGENDGVVLTFVDINDLKRAESEERQRRQQQSLAELSRQALTGGDLDTLLTAATHRVAEVLDMELCKVLELQPDGKRLLLKAGVGWQTGLVGHATVTAAATVQAGYTLHSHAPVVVRDLRTETRFRSPDMLNDHGVRSGISVAVPLQGPGVTEGATMAAETNPLDAYGVLSVHSRQPRAFATYDVDYLQAVANLLAAAIARRRTEAAVRASEERFRSLIEHASDAIFIANLDGVYLDVNSSACHLLGYERHELIGKRIKELLVVAEQPKLDAAQTYLLETGETQVAEWRLLRKDGTTVQVEVSAKVLPNGIWQAIARDITERKQTERILRRYADMLRLSYDAIMIWSLERGVEFWNHGAETLYGYSEAEALGKVSHELLATRHPQPLATLLTTLQREGFWEGEVIHTTKAGKTVVVSTRHQLITDEQGERLVLEINRDITAHKQAEIELRESEERFRLMADAAPVLIWVAGLDQGGTFFNSAWLAFTGRTLEQESGHGWMEGIHPDDYERALTIYSTAFAARQSFEMEYRLRRHDGTYRWVLDQGAPRLASDGRFTGFIGGCIDIDERKQAEAILARYQLLSNQARDIILFMRLDGQIVEANEAAVKAYGYDHATLLKMRIQDLRDPTTHAQIDDQITEADRTDDGRGIRFETLHRRRNGTVFPVEVSSIGATVGGERLLVSVIRDSSERKAAEAALAASEAKFATAFSLSPLILTITSLADGRLLEVNESFVQTTGYARAEALGRTPDELALWAEPQARVTGLAKLAAGEVIKDVEALFRMKDGQLRTCLMGATIVTINGQPCALTALTDITERKAAEAALRQSEERFATIFHHSPYPIAIVSLTEGRYVHVNPTWERDTGHTQAEVVGRKPAEIGLSIAPRLHLRQRLVENGALRAAEVQLNLRDGRPRTVLMSAELIQLHGEPHALVVFTDITERKRTEAALQASEAQLRLVTDNTSGLISYVDHDERYRFVNAIYEQWLSRPREQILGHTVLEILGKEAYAVAQPQIRRALAGERITFENTIAYTDGQTRTVLTTYVPDISTEESEQGAVLGFYALITDITARKHAEERLRFLAEASHILAQSLDYRTTLHNVARAAVPDVADWCVIDLLDEEDQLSDGFIAHVDPAKVHWAQTLRERYPVDMNAPVGPPAVIRTGKSEFYPAITDAMLQQVAKNDEELALLRSVGYCSLMIVPLQAHGRILGTITFVATESERHFMPDDLTMAEELARRAAAALGNAQLHTAVQQREQALRISEERLRLATEAGNIGIYDHDLVTGETTYSAIYRAITGILPNEELTRDAWLQRVHPADRDRVQEKLTRAVTHGESYDYEYRITHPRQNDLRWLRISSRVSVNEAGQAIRMTGALSDITERKQAEEEIQRLNRDLRRRLDELQSLLDVAPIGIFVAHDPACQVITSNAVGAKMLGIQTAENASKSAPSGDALPFRVFHHGRELLPEELPMQYAVTHDMAVLNFEADVVRSSGEVINLYEYALPLHDEEGNVRGCLGVFVDITARKQAETFLRESEERFRSAFEQAAVGMAHVNMDGRYLRVNARLCEILGYTSDELLQKNFLELTHPDDRRISLALSEQLLSGAIPSYSTEKRYLCRDGTIKWVNITASVVLEADGDIKYRLVVIEDIETRKAAETALRELMTTLEQRVAERTAELERSNRELDQFAYVASHDLKAPLRAIVNLAGWIAEDAGEQLPAASLDHLDKLRGRALRMERLLDDLLTYSRVGRREGVVEEIKTDVMIQDTVYLLAPPTGFQVKLVSAMPSLLTPRTPLELVFRNLISNAIKHHQQPTQGEVRIQARDAGDFVEFWVSDNGPGIEPQYHERIFGMFQTLRPRDEIEGSGMGLAIAKRAVEYRGGVIHVESSSREGTTFRFTWPKRLAQLS